MERKRRITIDVDAEAPSDERSQKKTDAKDEPQPLINPWSGKPYVIHSAHTLC